MSGVVVAFMFAAGVTAWVYAKIDRRDGGNMQSSIIVAAITFILTFAVALSIMDKISG